MSSLFKIGTINNISRAGLQRFSKQNYKVGKIDSEKPLENPVAIMLRSHKLQNSEIDKSVSIIARCGAGTNNIPVDKMSKRGIPVLNTPGANANSVKELVLCSLLLSSRDILGGIKHVQDLTDHEGFSVAGSRIEKDKKMFSGAEIKGKTLGVIGLGAIGSKVATAASSLGMKVVGYDPELTIKNALLLDGNKFTHVDNIETCVGVSDYISLHVPVINGVTDNLINNEVFTSMKPGCNLLNFSRDSLVDHQHLLSAINNGTFTGKYITDFPNEIIQGHNQCITIPHLGASTVEAEENSARMAADTIIDFLEHGTITNSVNFPTTILKRRKDDTTRICIVNENKGGMLMGITNLLYTNGFNIDQQINTSRENIAYNVIDVDKNLDSQHFSSLHHSLQALDGILSVRIISGENSEQQSYLSNTHGI